MNLLVSHPCKAPGIELAGAGKEKTETLTQQSWDCVGQALQWRNHNILEAQDVY